jgi:hypothetical protein
MSNLKKYLFFAWLVLVLILTPIFLSAPIWWKIGPPPSEDFDSVEGRIVIPNYKSRNEFKPHKYLLIQTDGSIREIHCGFIVVKRECPFDDLFFTHQEVRLEGKFHWYWGLLEYRATSANGKNFDSSTREATLKYFFKGDRKFQGLGVWFFAAGVMIFFLVLCIFVLFPIWLSDKFQGLKK